jgi:hypothetical protein
MSTSPPATTLKVGAVEALSRSCARRAIVEAVPTQARAARAARERRMILDTLAIVHTLSRRFPARAG